MLSNQFQPIKNDARHSTNFHSWNAKFTYFLTSPFGKKASLRIHLVLPSADFYLCINQRCINITCPQIIKISVHFSSSTHRSTYPLRPSQLTPMGLFLSLPLSPSCAPFALQNSIRVEKGAHHAQNAAHFRRPR